MLLTNTFFDQGRYSNKISIRCSSSKFGWVVHFIAIFYFSLFLPPKLISCKYSNNFVSSLLIPIISNYNLKFQSCDLLILVWAIRGKKIRNGLRFFSKKNCHCRIVPYTILRWLAFFRKFPCNLTPRYGGTKVRFKGFNARRWRVT